MSKGFQTPIRLPDGTIVGSAKDLGIVHVGTSAPTSPQHGTTWVDTDDLPPLMPAGPWQAIPLTNGWVNYASTAWQNAEYRKEPGNVVRLRGLVNGASASGTSGILGTLPTDFSPPLETMFICPMSGSGGTNMARVDVSRSGDIILRYAPDLSPDWLGLFDISYSLDAT